MQQSARRPLAVMNSFSTTNLHLRNPWVVAFFAFSYPGFGNMLQQRYAKAFIMILWEVFINNNAKINLAIMYTMQGHFEQAKSVIDQRWFILYIAVYMFAIWDGYRSSIDLNKITLLAQGENATIPMFKASIWDVNYLDKRKPFLALIWSILLPGLGHLYVHKVITGIFIFSYTITISYFSHFPQAIQRTMVGDFTEALSIIDMQWFMFFPSIYWFILYDAYSSAVELNKLFEREQSKYLRDYYQPLNFPMPL